MRKKLLGYCAIVLLLIPTLVFGAMTESVADKVTINESIKWALDSSPRLKILTRNREALVHELRQADGNWLPSVDLASSYGYDKHSDSTTRQNGADPGDDEWESRDEISLTLRQRLYDGGEASSRSGVQQAKLKSINHRVRDNAESIALDAVIAHLSVYRNTILLLLAERNIKDHEEILKGLVERHKGGAGSSVDVTQAQGRHARARASLLQLKAELAASAANYERVVGRLPGDLQMAKIPDLTPINLADALAQTEKWNPKVLAAAADIDELKSKKELAKSADYPKIFFELSKSYQHQVRGEDTWQDNEAGLLKMTWNLYNGGSDSAGKKAALARIRQGSATRQNELLYALENTRSTWAKYQSIIETIKIYHDAVDFNQSTLDAYLKQFNLSQRSLLDVLDAENELFQTSGLMVTAQVNELVATSRVLAVGGILTEAYFPPLDLELEPAVEKSKAVQLARIQERIKLEILFDTSSFVVTDDFYPEIIKVVNFLKKYPKISGVIEGHTDGNGSEKYNRVLSQRRADAVVAVMVNVFEIDPARLSAIGYGLSRPIATNRTADGRTKNRRIEALFVGN
ncbi:MAG: TolC family outer membrane protein [Desulfuromonadales bacterium]|nr:TolC family outer membrane protein [Desulfuromonadales bacterium]